LFKRRKQRSLSQFLAEGLYPRGGWIRAASYVWHRLRRLPDPPHRIARGVAAGVFVCFTPFFGFHFILATIIAILIQGNILAALLSTFFGNPFTFPIIAALSVDLGTWMLGLPGGQELPSIVGEFSQASVQIWANLKAIFTHDVTHWDRLATFFDRVFLPYLVGGIIPGLITAFIAFLIFLPLVRAHQTNRIRRLKQRHEKRQRAAARRAADAARKGSVADAVRD